MTEAIQIHGPKMANERRSGKHLILIQIRAETRVNNFNKCLGSLDITSGSNQWNDN